MSFHVPEQFRIREGELASTAADGNNGAFAMGIKRPSGLCVAFVIASDGEGWEHASLTIRQGKKLRMPTWDDMCAIKDLFWDADDCVVQFHPPESAYISNHPTCLHLWRPTHERLPTPPSWMVGARDHADLERIKRERGLPHTEEQMIRQALAMQAERAPALILPGDPRW